MVKAVISGIKRMEVHDGDGLRTTVFFKGCPLKCLWCHNPESITYEKEIAKSDEKCIHCCTCVNVCEKSAFSFSDGKIVLDKNKCNSCMKCAEVCPVTAIIGYGREYSIEELVEEILKDRVFYRETGGVTLSGGECLTQSEFVTEFAKVVKSCGISVFVDTCGYVKREILDDVLPYTDKFLYDIKAIDSDLHKKLTGKDNKIILENLLYLAEKRVPVEIRYPLVKGYNDNECEKIAEFVKSLNGNYPIKVLRYHDFARSRYIALQRKDTLPKEQTTFKDVDSVKEKMRKCGVIII